MVALMILFVTAASTPAVWGAGAEKININVASAEELTQLKGIGPKFAARIVDYRQAHGPFEHVEDVLGIPGIGQKALDMNKDVMTVK